VPKFVGARLGTVSSDGDPIEVDVSFEAAPSVVWDAAVLPGGVEAQAALARLDAAVTFIREQYLHCKTLLALGGANGLLDVAVPAVSLPDGSADPGIVVVTAAPGAGTVKRFVAALARHRHYERETALPMR